MKNANNLIQRAYLQKKCHNPKIKNFDLKELSFSGYIWWKFRISYWTIWQFPLKNPPVGKKDPWKICLLRVPSSRERCWLSALLPLGKSIFIIDIIIFSIPSLGWCTDTAKLILFADNDWLQRLSAMLFLEGIEEGEEGTEGTVFGLWGKETAIQQCFLHL